MNPADFPCAHLGVLAHRLRLQRARSVDLISVGALGRTLTPPALTDAFEAQGYHLSPEAYIAIEAGRYLPLDVSAFIVALTICLDLDDEVQVMLRRQAAMDILRSMLGDTIALACLSEMLPAEVEVEYASVGAPGW